MALYSHSGYKTEGDITYGAHGRLISPVRILKVLNEKAVPTPPGHNLRRLLISEAASAMSCQMEESLSTDVPKFHEIFVC